MRHRRVAEHPDHVQQRVRVAKRRDIQQGLGAALRARHAGDVCEFNGCRHPLPGVEQRGQLVEAIVWDVRRSRYVVRRFERDDPRIAALLVHLGRAFITEATLRVGVNQNLRCVSSVDIPASELLGRGGPRTFDSFLHEFN